MPYIARALALAARSSRRSATGVSSLRSWRSGSLPPTHPSLEPWPLRFQPALATLGPSTPGGKPRNRGQGPSRQPCTWRLSVESALTGAHRLVCCSEPRPASDGGAPRPWATLAITIPSCELQLRSTLTQPWIWPYPGRWACAGPWP